MANVEYIRFVPRLPEVRDGAIHWVETRRPAIERLPQILWANHSTWGEANAWALDQATSRRKDIKTVHASMIHLLAYAKWLEAEDIGWWHFPNRESERCLTRFRGALIRARDAGELAPSTASKRMAIVVRFYRWLRATGLLSTEWPMWSERQIGIRLTDPFGFERTIRVNSTDLSIPNRAITGAIQLEEGLMPLTVKGMHQLQDFADANGSEELALMLRIGFGTGLRLGSILDLKIKTLENAVVDPIAGWHRVAVGPAARPPVRTKFGVSGMVPIPLDLLMRLREYGSSVRRVKRQVQASSERCDLLFLTRFGERYSTTESRAINVELSRLRDKAEAQGVTVLRDFHFHRTRATFATMLMRAALKCVPVGDAIRFVGEACLHKDAETTLKYVRFIESTKQMSEAADAFTEAFMGLARGGSSA